MSKPDTTEGVSVNIYFHSNKSTHMNMIVNHDKWFDEVKSDFLIEDFILMKYLKTWRRCKGLHKIKPQILEVLVYKTGKSSLCEKVINYFLIPLFLGIKSIRKYNRWMLKT
jgi:hypothetical protein